MDEQVFWQQLSNLGGLQQVWWYTALATPALLVGGVALLVMVFASRHIEQKLTVFLLCLLACIPLLLIVPSFWAGFRPRAALAFAGVPWPGATNQLPRQVAQTLSVYLGVLAQLGITGAVTGLLIALGGLTITASSTNVPVLSTAARQVTQVVRDKTQRFRRSPTADGARTAGSSLSSPYGRFEVLTGAHTGTQIALRPGNTIGRKECDIVLSDSIVSRQHARIEVDEHRQTTLADLQSANGLFVYRTDETGVEQKHDLSALNGLPFALRSGDQIAFGDPDHPEDGANAVKLRFDHEYF